MNYVSLCTGIGGFDHAFDQAGMTCVAQCEIDPDARAVLREHWPDVLLHDDIVTFTKEHLNGTVVDLVCAGTPCQDLSVAGRRAGLGGERSRLFYEFVRVADDLAAPWICWENVPGLLSSNDGADFGLVLRELTGFWPATPNGGWRNSGVCAGPRRTVAWRVLDSQFFGVAQRRRRVFIVGCAGDPAGAAQVLFEPESGHGDPPPRRTAGTRVAASLTAGTASGRGVNPPGRRQEDDINLVGSLMAGSDGRGWRIGADEAAAGQLIPSFARSLTASERWDGDTALAMRGRDQGAELEIGDEGVYNALRAGDGSSSRGQMVAYNPWRTLEKDGTITSGWAERPVVDALHGPTGNKEPLVMGIAENQRGEVLETEYSRQLTTGGGKPGQGYPAVRDGMQVRRLTPVECERLQGFPDGWTAGRSDSVRYRLLGNAVCVPVAAWIGRRLRTTDNSTYGERP